MKLIILKVILITLFISIDSYSQNKQIEKVILEFKYFKYPDTEYILDYNNNELTCKMVGFDRSREIIYNEKYKFSNEQIEKLNNELLKDIPKSDKSKGEDGYDGGGFIINFFKNKNKVIKLEVRNANWDTSKYKSELNKITAFFDFAYSIVKDSIGISIIDTSYGPYFTGLPIRKVSENPLEYKIWRTMKGSIIYNKHLSDFLNGLPKGKCVIVDCNDKLSYAIQQDILELYILTDSNIKFVNNGYLKHTQDEVNELLKDLELFKGDVAKFDEKYSNTFTYQLYMSNPDKIKDWAKLPKESLGKNMNEIRNECKE